MSFSGNYFLVFLEGLGWLRGSSIGVCEALCDMLACKKSYTNTFVLDFFIDLYIKCRGANNLIIFILGCTVPLTLLCLGVVAMFCNSYY